MSASPVSLTVERRISAVNEVRTQDPRGQVAIVEAALFLDLADGDGQVSRFLLPKGDVQRFAGHVAERVKVRVDLIQPDTPASPKPETPADGDGDVASIPPPNVAVVPVSEGPKADAPVADAKSRARR